MADWTENLVTARESIADIVRGCRRIAVLGIKTEAQRGEPAFYVPEYMARAGYDIVPVPVYYPDAREILGRSVHRTVAAVAPPVDMVNVFRRSKDIPPHVPDILAARHPRGAGSLLARRAPAPALSGGEQSGQNASHFRRRHAGHSTIQSARASTVGGTVSPSAFAVLRLIASSNLLGCSMGSSPGLAPLRIWST